MKKKFETIGYLIVLCQCIILLLSGFTEQTQKRPPATLGVPTFGQQGLNLCWAACAEMVSSYIHDSVDANAPIITQCEEARRGWNIPDSIPCPPVLYGDTTFDRLGSPFQNSTDDTIFQTWAYPHFADTSPMPYGAAPPDTLAFEFINKRPVIFCWNWFGFSDSIIYKKSGHQLDSAQGSHWLVAEGRPEPPYGGRKGWIAVNDPEPVLSSGHHMIINFSGFTNRTNVSTWPGKHSKRAYNENRIFYNYGGTLYGIKYIGSN